MIPQRVPILSGGISLHGFLAAQEAGFWLRFPRTDTSFQETVGPTPADGAGEPIGLTLDQRMWLGQTREQYLAGQAENRQNGAPVLAGSATAATYNTSTGAGTVTRVDFANQSGVAISGLIGGRVYAIDIDAPANLIFRDGTSATGAALSSTIAGRQIYFVASSIAASGITLSAHAPGGTQAFTLHSIKEVSQVSATQATAGSRPTWQPGGATFDGTADNLLTNYTAGSGSNTLIARVTVPASLAATGFLAGAQGGDQGANGRFYLGVDTAGRLVGGVGLQGVSNIIGTSDLRGQTVVVALSFDGSNVRLFAGAAQEYEAAQSGPVTLNIPLRIGSGNPSGSPATFWPGSISDAIAWRGGPILDENTFRRIAEQLNNL